MHWKRDSTSSSSSFYGDDGDDDRSPAKQEEEEEEEEEEEDDDDVSRFSGTTRPRATRKKGKQSTAQHSAAQRSGWGF